MTTKKVLLRVQRGSYMVGAFNAENVETVKTVIDITEELEASVILQTTLSTVKYGNLLSFTAMVTTEAGRRQVVTALHLGHGNSSAPAAQALRDGYMSLMIGRSYESFKEDIELVRKVVEMVGPNDIPVEVKLGKVEGKEDELTAESDVYTDPEQAREFVERTGIDFLTVATGIAHGFYKEISVLDQDRLREIWNRVTVSLVLRGASGLGDQEIRGCIQRGICKVNFATELRTVYTDAVKKLLKEKPDVYDPRKLGEAGIERVRQVVRNKIQVCDCMHRV